MSSGWTLTYEGIDPETEPLREALCTLGNGRFATRGAAAESRADETHYPGTYIAGGYDRLTSSISGRAVVNEDLVNVPNWLPLSFRPGGGSWLGEGAVEHAEYRQELDLRHGVLRRSFVVKDAAGRETRVRERRIVHMGNARLAAISQEIAPLNWSGPLEIRSELDGAVTNRGVERYRELRGNHVEVISADATESGTIWLHARTVQSRVEMVLAARTTVRSEGASPTATSERCGNRMSQTYALDASPGRAIEIEKVVALSTSRDPALGDLVEDAILAVDRAGAFDQLVVSHQEAWTRLWDRFDVEIDIEPADDLAPFPIQLILRLHTFHLLQTASPHTMELDASVPARGLHGEAYRGHIFWDEMYVLPFFLTRTPEIARSLLLYRFRRLPEARASAAEDGRAGAMFPWQSGSSGREETQIIHLNPRSGAWDPDRSRLQRHVNAAIAKNVWDYVRATGDREFLARHGAELLLEIARFWASMFEETAEGGFGIDGVMGPDEFHEAYPDAHDGGVRNNAYTNVMAAWCLDAARRALDLLGDRDRADVAEAIALTEHEVERWEAIARGVTVPTLPEGLMEQFEGYGRLEELDWDAYRETYGNIGRLDRILRAEGDSPDRYKVSKQADLCMLFYVLEDGVLIDLLRRAGYELTEEKRRETIEYYRRRTSHGSTLSHVVFASILHGIDSPAAWEHFLSALRSDVEDIQGGTTPEGIHTAVMAGTVRYVLERIAGTSISDGRLHLSPRLPDAVRSVEFSQRVGDTLVRIRVERTFVDVESLDRKGRPVEILVGDGARRVLQPGDRVTVSLV